MGGGVENLHGLKVLELVMADVLGGATGPHLVINRRWPTMSKWSLMLSFANPWFLLGRREIPSLAVELEETKQALTIVKSLDMSVRIRGP